jgi:hypothetical protein
MIILIIDSALFARYIYIALEPQQESPIVKKPENIEEYLYWLKERLNVDITEKHKRLYDSATTFIQRDFEASLFWKKLIKALPVYRDEYKIQTGYDLFSSEIPPVVCIKPFNSFIEKTYRKNVIYNTDWPNPPNSNWIIPDNWDSRISDIIRTSIVVKYLDGVEFIGAKIKALCEKYKKSCSFSLEASEVGYYAAHLYTIQKFEIPTFTWETRKISLSIEIQITTQLQEAIKKLIHKYYEEERCRIAKADLKWQWNYKSDEFAANYLGHILHYIEGMIMEIRERREGRTKNEKIV